MSLPGEIVFNPLPHVYDDVMGPLYFEPFAREMAARVADLQPRRMLETACGTGRVTAHLRRVLPDASLVATDILPSMLDFARKKMKADPEIAWELADAQALPFQDGAFDAVVCQFGAMFFSDTEKAFAEAYRVLAPGGAFHFSVWDRLETNPLGACGRDVLKTFFTGRLPESLKLAYALCDVPPLAAQLLACGFRTVGHDVVQFPCETPSARAFSHAYVYGSSVRSALAAMDAGTAERLEAALCSGIASRFGDAPVKSHMQAVLFTAHKPS
jgi:ubiquinone/menaquinone biosynthesis C-methylase UbiE